MLNDERWRRNRRFKIYLIWSGEIGILLTLKIIFSKVLDTSLVADIAKYSTILAVTAITGLSGVHMVRDWANGMRKKISKPLPEPSEEEEETQ